MVWVNGLIWIAAFAMCIVGGGILIQTGMADFEPWKQARRRLILAAFLVSVPAYVLAFQFLPIPLAVVLSLAATSLAVLQFVMVVPEKWRRVVGKRK